MKIIDKLIRKLGYEYIDNIKINIIWKKPNVMKMLRKRYYYIIYGMYESKIIINKNNTLVDGYTTYLLEKEKGKKIVRVKRI